MAQISTVHANSLNAFHQLLQTFDAGTTEQERLKLMHQIYFSVNWNNRLNSEESSKFYAQCFVGNRVLKENSYASPMLLQITKINIKTGRPRTQFQNYLLDWDARLSLIDKDPHHKGKVNFKETICIYKQILSLLAEYVTNPNEEQFHYIASLLGPWTHLEMHYQDIFDNDIEAWRCFCFLNFLHPNKLYEKVVEICRYHLFVDLNLSLQVKSPANHSEFQAKEIKKFQDLMNKLQSLLEIWKTLAIEGLKNKNVG